MNKEYTEEEIKIKSKLDNAMFEIYKDEKVKIFTDIEKTSEGYNYKINIQ